MKARFSDLWEDLSSSSDTDATIPSYRIEILDSRILSTRGISSPRHKEATELTECVWECILEQTGNIRIFEARFHVRNDFLIVQRRVGNNYQPCNWVHTSTAELLNVRQTVLNW